MIYHKKIAASNRTLSKIKNYSGVILFGTGNLGKIVLKALEKAKINIVAIADNNSLIGIKLGVATKFCQILS